jgi:polyhydroxyalkanoate synthesis regulator phasin
MTLLDEAKKNGHAEPATRAWDARLARIKRRIAEIAETGDQRVAILRDALADFTAAELAQRDGEIRTLKQHIADLENKLQQKTAVDQQVHEIAMRLEEKAARRDEAKRGPQGVKGPKGDKGDKGAPGKNGISKTLKQTIRIERWDIDRASFTVRGFLSDGSETPVLDLRPLFEEYQAQVG